MLSNSPRVLVVDDDEMVRAVVVRTLITAGFEVLEADCFDAAMQILHRTATHSPVQLLLTDVNMPGAESGNDLAEIATEVWPGLKVLVMTGRLLQGEEQRYQVILKPFRRAALVEAVVRVMNAT